MKNRIRQILREETSGFDPKELKVFYQFMNHLTKGYNWYYDTPGKRFEWSPGSIWLINPETKEWVLELTKEGKLWWNRDFYRNFQRYFNMEMSDYKKFIKIWVEDVLNIGVSTTTTNYLDARSSVEDVLNIGVSTTGGLDTSGLTWVKDVLKNGKELK